MARQGQGVLFLVRRGISGRAAEDAVAGALRRGAEAEVGPPLRPRQKNYIIVYLQKSFN